MSEKLFFNGIDGDTGGYLKSPSSFEEVAEAVARSRWVSPGGQRELKELKARAVGGDNVAAADGVDPRDLSRTGWAVIFHRRCDPAVREALEPLLRHRKKEAAKRHASLYREFAGETGYRTGQSKWDFYEQLKVSQGGAADPRELPYYFLIVGGPEQIPYRFQYELDIERAVGRVCFERPEDYEAYARAVVAAEQPEAARPPRAVFFGTANEDDEATQLSARYLVEPLAEYAAREHPGWSSQLVLETEATKARLASLLGGAETPALLFTACHGASFAESEGREPVRQGALVCQDWPGPLRWGKRLPPDFYFSADDVPAAARLSGLIAFHFSCYSAGTPATPDFTFPTDAQALTPAPEPRASLSALPRRLLSHAGGGALAVVGHVDRAWNFSFMSSEDSRSDLITFEHAVGRLMKGFPVGYAVELFNQRHAALAAAISNEILYGGMNNEVGKKRLGRYWLISNDARNYVVVGDPAVRLNVSA